MRRPFRPNAQRESTGSAHRFGTALSMASIACRIVGDASSNFNAIFMVQVPSLDTSLSILELTPNKSFGVISSARHKSEIRVDATAFVPRSYFWICWKVTPRALPSSVWLSPSFTRRIRITDPIFFAISQSRLRATSASPSKESPASFRFLSHEPAYSDRMLSGSQCDDKKGARRRPSHLELTRARRPLPEAVRILMHVTCHQALRLKISACRHLVDSTQYHVAFRATVRHGGAKQPRALSIAQS